MQTGGRSTKTREFVDNWGERSIFLFPQIMKFPGRGCIFFKFFPRGGPKTCDNFLSLPYISFDGLPYILRFIGILYI